MFCALAMQGESLEPLLQVERQLFYCVYFDMRLDLSAKEL